MLKHCIETAPHYAGSTIKFVNFGNSNYLSQQVSESLRTLERAMIVNLIYPTTAVEAPMLTNKRKSPKLFFLDIGLVNYINNLQAKFFNLADLNSLSRGQIAEQAIAQQLLSRNSSLHLDFNFWVREKAQSSAEVGLMINYQNQLIPIEVKSGKVGKLRSLHQFMDRSQGEVALRFTSSEFQVDQVKTPAGKQFTLINLPHYLASQIELYLESFS